MEKLSWKITLASVTLKREKGRGGRREAALGNERAAQPSLSSAADVRPGAFFFYIPSSFFIFLSSFASSFSSVGARLTAAFVLALIPFKWCHFESAGIEEVGGGL